jgi:hypothetical protein
MPVWSIYSTWPTKLWNPGRQTKHNPATMADLWLERTRVRQTSAERMIQWGKLKQHYLYLGRTANDVESTR